MQVRVKSHIRRGRRVRAHLRTVRGSRRAPARRRRAKRR